MNCQSVIPALFLSAAILFSPQPAQAVSCTVPNSISNGQVADATKVMDNFNAVANCAQQAVTATGTPMPGSIAVFSGSNTIGNGNLSGDVTTSGSSATTLSNSGVTAGTYSSANITVDAKGRVLAAANGGGGSGGGAWWFSPPSASQFTLASETSPNLTLANGQGGLLVDGGAPVSGDVSRIAYQTLNDKNAVWDLKARIEGLLSKDSSAGFGIMMRDSSSGRITALGTWQDGTIVVTNHSSYANWTSNDAVIATQDSPKWLRIQHDGTNYNFFISADGEQWTNIASAADTSWLTGKADQVGLEIEYNRPNGGMNTTMVVQYYSLVQ